MHASDGGRCWSARKFVGRAAAPPRHIILAHGDPPSRFSCGASDREASTDNRGVHVPSVRLESNLHPIHFLPA